MDDGVVGGVVSVVGSGVHQHLQASPLPGRHRDHGNAQHLRKAVKVQLHAPLGDNVHHIEGYHHRLTQFQKLEGEIQVPLQGRGVHHVDDHVHLVRKDKLPGNLLLHGVRSKGVGAGQVHQADVQVVVLKVPSTRSTVTPGQLATFRLAPVYALKRVVFPQLGLPMKATVSCFAMLHYLDFLGDPPTQGHSGPPDLKYRWAFFFPLQHKHLGAQRHTQSLQPVGHLVGQIDLGNGITLSQASLFQCQHPHSFPVSDGGVMVSSGAGLAAGGANNPMPGIWGASSMGTPS